jgi:anti-sigma regulatory factor (Ser/Thr protein kinase)
VAVTPPPAYHRLNLPAEVHSLRLARQWIIHVAGHLPTERLEEAVLVTHELVSNSIRHAGLSKEQTIEVTAEVSRDRVRVTVADGGRGFSPPKQHGAGQGLLLVAALADRVVIDGERGVVSFDIETPA